MIGTVIGPGTIFLMLVGAFVTVFQISQYTALLYNTIPVFIFVLTCIVCKSDTQVSKTYFGGLEKTVDIVLFQLLVAAIISAVYGLIMMMVLIGVAMQIHDDGLMAPSSLFFLIMMGKYALKLILELERG